jgi:SEFIR domain
MGADAVFISYSHDSPEHSDNVLALASALIQMGLQVELDQFVTRPPQGWPHWCVEQLRPESAKFVLMICTREYCDRIENRVEFDKGRGAYWEGALIHQYIYEGKGNTRFIPVLLNDATDDCVPFRLRPYPRYRLKAFDFSDTEFKKLYRELTNQPAIIKPMPGRPVVLPPRTISKNEAAIAAAVTPKAGAVVRPPADIARNEPKIISLFWGGITFIILSALYYTVDILYLSNFLLNLVNDHMLTSAYAFPNLYNGPRRGSSLIESGFFLLFISVRLSQYLYAILFLIALSRSFKNYYLLYLFVACLVIEFFLLLFSQCGPNCTGGPIILVFPMDHVYGVTMATIQEWFAIGLYALIWTSITTLAAVASFLIYRSMRPLKLF